MNKQTYFVNLDNTLHQLKSNKHQAGYLFSIVDKSGTTITQPLVNNWYILDQTPINSSLIESHPTIIKYKKQLNIPVNEYRIINCYVKTGNHRVLCIELNKDKASKHIINSIQDILGPCSFISHDENILSWVISIPVGFDVSKLKSVKFSCVDVKYNYSYFMIPGCFYSFQYNDIVESRYNNLVDFNSLLDDTNSLTPESYSFIVEGLPSLLNDRFEGLPISKEIANMYISDHKLPIGLMDDVMYSFLYQMIINRATVEELKNGYKELKLACSQEPGDSFDKLFNKIITDQSFKPKGRFRLKQIETITSKGVSIDGKFRMFNPLLGNDWIDLKDLYKEVSEEREQEEVEKIQRKKNVDYVFQRHYKKVEIQEVIIRKFLEYEIYYLPNIDRCLCYKSGEDFVYDKVKYLFPITRSDMIFPLIYDELYDELFPSMVGYEDVLRHQLREYLPIIFNRTRNDKKLHRKIFKDRYYDRDKNVLWIFLRSDRYLKISKSRVYKKFSCSELLTGTEQPNITPITISEFDIKPTIEWFKEFFNINDKQFLDILTFLVHLYLPQISNKNLLIKGTVGSGTTTMAMCLRSIFDPKGYNEFCTSNTTEPTSNAIIREFANSSNGLLIHFDNVNYSVALHGFIRKNNLKSVGEYPELMISDPRLRTNVYNETCRYGLNVIISINEIGPLTINKFKDIQNTLEWIVLNRRKFNSVYLNNDAVVQDFLTNRKDVFTLIMKVVVECFTNIDKIAAIRSNNPHHSDYDALKVYIKRTFDL